MARRVGLLTLPLHVNYGGIVQAVALYNFLAGHGKEVTFLSQRPNRKLVQRVVLWALRTVPFQNIQGLRGRYLRRQVHKPFLDRWMPNRTRELLSFSELSRAVTKRRLEAVIVGSDQVWRRSYVPADEFTNYFLDFVGDDVAKIAYAASFGASEWTESEALTARISALLARFSKVMLREQSGVEICREKLGRPDAELVLDPTLLMPASFYEPMAAPPSARAGRDVMKYVLDHAGELAGLEARAQEQLGQDSAVHGIHLQQDSGMPATIPQWLAEFRDAGFVLTDSFHGMAFSIIFRRQFVALVNTKRGADRFVTLARQLGLEDRLIFIGEGTPFPDQPIDYDKVGARLEERRAACARALLSALD
ncbi:polysaccharide pyruvyl transferase family protein [Paenirhodobacter populi]|uniref:Polysaccharide pyruvyl transferase family protein n=1 Tax=Paenirhodobacter populi TaxID=2306993 RepID=A0A443IP40_9RHOB|nr:polysaccharide pyruvyl transferase family protein [Sinirhodobacter populi]RWR08145.1 polysaccharide pyruvyl transferase family protein [Sinirhodobacter populi]